MIRALLAEPITILAVAFLVGFFLRLGDALAATWTRAAGVIWRLQRDWWTLRRLYGRDPAKAPEWARQRLARGYWRSVWR